MLPSDFTVECSMNYQTEFDTWVASFHGSDTCGSATVSHDAPATISCPQEVTVTFTLIDECGNFDEKIATFTAEDTLGTVEETENHITVFPNPTSGSIVVDGLLGDGYLELYTASGRLVLNRAIENNLQIELNLNSGLYFAKIKQDNSIAIRKIIVK